MPGTATPASSSSETPTPSAVFTPEMPVETPPGTTRISSPPDWVTAVMTIGPQDQVVVSDGPQAHKGVLVDIVSEPQDVVVRTGEVTRTVDRLPSGPDARYPIAADTDGEYLVWVETSSTDVGTTPYAIGAAKLAGGPTTLIASETDRDVPGPDRVFVSDGRVYWVGGRPNPGSFGFPDVVSAPVGGGPSRVEVANASNLRVAGGFLWYTVSARERPAKSPGVVDLHRCDLASGVDTLMVSVAGDALSYAVAGETWGWVQAGPTGNTLVLHRADGRVDRYTFTAGGAVIVAMSQNLVGLSIGEGDQYYIDLRDTTVHHLGTVPGFYGIEVGGSTIAWPTGPGEWALATIA